MIKCFLQSQVAAVHQIKVDVIRSLSLYYYTFVDILEFRVRSLVLHL